VEKNKKRGEERDRRRQVPRIVTKTMKIERKTRSKPAFSFFPVITLTK
jgi:hypothetical protein